VGRLTPIILAIWEAEVGGLLSEAAQGKVRKTRCQKQAKSKRVSSVAQVLEQVVA
jgi:hypothetical protein